MMAKIMAGGAFVVFISILVAVTIGATPEWMMRVAAVAAGAFIFFLGVDEFGGKHGPRF